MLSIKDAELSTFYSTPPPCDPLLPGELRPPGPPGPHTAELRQGLRGVGLKEKREIYRKDFTPPPWGPASAEVSDVRMQ